MPDKTSAKRSAFLAVCKELYYKGELGLNLLPRPRNIEDYKCDYLDELSSKAEAEKENVPGKIGTRKRVQQYLKKVMHPFLKIHVMYLLRTVCVPL